MELSPDDYFDGREFAVRDEVEARHYWHLHRREVIRNELMRAMPTGPLIEIGCGPGTVTTYLNERGFNVDYADVHQAALDVAQARARARLGERAASLRFLLIDASNQDLPHGYGGALIFDVLEHLPDDLGTLVRVRRALTPGALIAFTVPAFQLLWSPWDELQKHRRRYTLESARALAEEAGLEVQRITYFFLPLFPAALGVKCLRQLRGAVRRSSAPGAVTDLVEMKTNTTLNTVLLGVLGLERRWLRRSRLPFGTSILCVARTK